MTKRLIPHPRTAELEKALRACLLLICPWAGDAFRMVEAPYANTRDLLSGKGAALHGERWNPPGIRTVYACLDDSLAMLEWQTQRKEAGMTLTRHLPLTQVTIITSLRRVLDFRQPKVVAAFGLSLAPFITEKHRAQIAGDPELLAQALGRIAAKRGIEALIVPAAPDPTRYNIVVYRPNLASASVLKIHGAKYLLPPPSK